jgi:hypothetical protein
MRDLALGPRRGRASAVAQPSRPSSCSSPTRACREASAKPRPITPASGSGGARASGDPPGRGRRRGTFPPAAAPGEPPPLRLNFARLGRRCRPPPSCVRP